MASRTDRLRPPRAFCHQSKKTPMTRLANPAPNAGNKDREAGVREAQAAHPLEAGRQARSVARRRSRRRGPAPRDSLVVEHLCDTEDTFLNRNEARSLIDEVLDETFGLGPLEMLLKEPIDQRNHDQRPEERLRRTAAASSRRRSVTFRDDKHLMQIIDRIVSKVGRRVDEVCPMVDARLPDGSRVNAIIPPLALDGPASRFGASARTR